MDVNGDGEVSEAEFILFKLAQMGADCQAEVEQARQVCPPYYRRTGACGYNRPCAQQYVGKYQSCMV